MDSAPSIPPRGEGTNLSSFRMSKSKDRWIIKRARQLRQDASDAEKRLWRALREPEFAHAKFRRQSPIGRYIVDFVSFQHKLVIEVDGGQHQETEQSKHDAVRTEWLNSQGFRVVRFWNDEVLTNTEAVLDVIYRALADSPR